MTFSLQQARSLIVDLYSPNPRIYWADFLGSMFGGLALSAGVRLLGENYAPTWTLRLLQAACFIGSILLFYRAVSFIHELAHLPHDKFRNFRIAWNVLCGIPFLIPSFLYYTHLDHHRRQHFGTPQDGEYIPFARRGWWHIVGYLATIPILPIVAVIRFAILTPLTWLLPGFRRWVHRRASSMVIDPSYLRPLPSPRTLQIIGWQELGCFLFCWGVVGVSLAVGRWPIAFVTQAYLTGVAIIALNSLRTLGAHRWWNDGGDLSFIDQLLDSVTVADHPWTSELWGPVGLRYHGLHHLFPTLPYHNLAEAHRRLMANLPADSPYRQTVEPSLTTALAKLLQRSRVAGQLARESQAAGQAA